MKYTHFVLIGIPWDRITRPCHESHYCMLLHEMLNFQHGQTISVTTGHLALCSTGNMEDKSHILQFAHVQNSFHARYDKHSRWISPVIATSVSTASG